MLIRTFASVMKKIFTLIATMLLCCGIGYTLEECPVPFTTDVPYKQGTIKMDFTFDRDWGFGWGTGSQKHNTPCVSAETEGELFIPDSIIVPNGSKMPVTWISRGSFQSCPNLTQVHLPKTIEHISDLSFSGCTSLREITFPDSLEWIYPRAFIGCTALQRVRFLSATPPNCYNNDNFDDVTYATATLVVPVKAAEAYLNNSLTYRFRYHAEVIPIYNNK